MYYEDGWHYSDSGTRLYLEDDGSSRPAVEGDLSWHERHHQEYVHVAMEDAPQPGLGVSAEEFEAIQQFLRERRGSA